MIPIIASLIPLLGSVLDKVIPNTAEREKVKAELSLKLLEQETELIRLLVESDKGQAGINKADAESGDKFRSYWRPALAWVCVVAYSWAYFLQPVVVFIAAFNGKILTDLPVFNLGEMTPVLMGILGLAGLRTYEKRNGVK